MAFTGPGYLTRRSGGRKRLGGVTAYGMLRNLLTVAVDEGRTVVVPISSPGRTTAVGAWLVAAVAELRARIAPITTEFLPNIIDRRCQRRIPNMLSPYRQLHGVSSSKPRSKPVLYMLQSDPRNIRSSSVARCLVLLYTVEGDLQGRWSVVGDISCYRA